MVGASLGAVMVPVNTACKGEMLRHICQDSQASHIISTSELVERFKSFGLDLNITDPAILAEGSGEKPKLDESIEPWDIHMVLYTARTTGPPKGAIIPYFKSYRESDRMWGSKATKDDTMLVDLPLFHVTGLSASYGLWMVGGRIALRTVFSRSRYLDIVRKCGATMSVLVGTMSAFLAKTPPHHDDVDNPLRVLCCAPLPSDPDTFMRRFEIEELFMVFGGTETGQILSVKSPTKNPKSCGKPSPGYEVRLVDDHDIPVSPGKVGELIVRTDLHWMTSVGCYGRPEETAPAWRNSWFHTGDMFTCDE